MALIYIVEDDINIREIERYALKNSGFEVEEFDNGKDFFQRVSELYKCYYITLYCYPYNFWRYQPYILIKI